MWRFILGPASVADVWEDKYLLRQLYIEIDGRFA